MIRNLLLFLLSVLALHASGQKIRYTDSHNRWFSLGIRTANDCTYSRVRTFGGDTLISGQTYKAMIDVFYGDSSALCGRYIDTSVYYYVREDTVASKVFYRCPDVDTEEHLLYNYNLHVGDTMVYYPSPTLAPYTPVLTDTVTAADSLLINGVYHKRFNMRCADPGYDYFTYTVIEGLGSICGSYASFHYGCNKDHEYLTCFSQNGSIPAITSPLLLCNSFPGSFTNGGVCIPTSLPAIPGNSITVSCSPNPTDGFFNVDAEGYTGQFNVTTYSMDGRKVDEHTNSGMITINTASWAPGVYFVVVQGSDGTLLGRDKMVISR